MKSRICPLRKHCWDAGNCETCDFGMAYEKLNKKIKNLKKNNENLKTENEELKKDLDATIAGQKTLQKFISTATSKAINGFAERLKELCSDETTDNTNNPCVRILYDAEETIDDLVKEMTEENTHEMQSTDQP